MITTRRRVPGRVRSRSAAIIGTRCRGRFRGARRIVEVMVTREGSRGSGSSAQALVSMPLGSTTTSRRPPVARRMSDAATSLTAE
jgi:hypothetical protein